MQEDSQKDLMKNTYIKRKSIFTTAFDKLNISNYNTILNGFARIIKFQNQNGDPSDLDNNNIISMYEGRIKDGKPHGFGRMIQYQGKDVKIGYWKKGDPYGKMI